MSRCYLRAPALSLDAMFNMTKKKLTYFRSRHIIYLDANNLYGYAMWIQMDRS